jgi:predicted nucleic acid-binding protein
MQTPKAVYIDTMVFIYHFLYFSKPNLARKAALFLKDIENGKYMGIVTSFTIAEYVAATRGLLCEKRNRQVSPKEVSAIKAKLEQFITQMGIMLYDSDTLATRQAVFAESESMIERDVPSKGKYDGRWHYLKGADALHAAFATSVNAEAIATFDDDFRGVCGSVSPLMLSEVY